MPLSKASPSTCALDPISSHLLCKMSPLWPSRSVFYLLVLALGSGPNPCGQHQPVFLVFWLLLGWKQGEAPAGHRNVGGGRLGYSPPILHQSLGLGETLFQLQWRNTSPITEAPSLDSDNCPWFSSSGERLSTVTHYPLGASHKSTHTSVRLKEMPPASLLSLSLYLPRKPSFNPVALTATTSLTARLSVLPSSPLDQSSTNSNWTFTSSPLKLLIKVTNDPMIFILLNPMAILSTHL